MFDGEPEIDTICAAPFKDQGDEYNYYRGKITSLSRTLQGITADVSLTAESLSCEILNIFMQ